MFEAVIHIYPARQAKEGGEGGMSVLVFEPRELSHDSGNQFPKALKSHFDTTAEFLFRRNQRFAPARGEGTPVYRYQ